MKKKPSKKAKVNKAIKKARHISLGKKKKALSKKSSSAKKKASSPTKKKPAKKQPTRAILKPKAKKAIKKSKATKVSPKKKQISSKKTLGAKKTSSLTKKKSTVSTNFKAVSTQKHSKGPIKVPSKPLYSAKSSAKKPTFKPTSPKNIPLRKPASHKTEIKLKTDSQFQQKDNQKLSKSEELTVNRVTEEIQKIEERKQEKKLILKDMEGRDYCLFEDCDFPAVSGEYCRLHYIGRWDYIRVREKLLKIGFIERKIEEILEKNSLTCITHFIGDFRSEKNFLTRIKPLLEDIDNLNEEDLFAKEMGDKAGSSEERY